MIAIGILVAAIGLYWTNVPAATGFLPNYRNLKRGVPPYEESFWPGKGDIRIDID